MALSCPSPLLLLLSEKLQTASPSHLHLHLLLLRLLFGLLLLLQPLERPLVVAAVLVSLAVGIRRRRNRNNAAAPSRLQSPELREMLRTHFFPHKLYFKHDVHVPLFQIGRGRRRLAYDVAQEQVRRRDWLRLSWRRRRRGPAVRVGIARVGGCRQVREGVERRRVDGTFAVSGTSSSPLSLAAVVVVVVVVVVPSVAAVEAVVAGGGSAARQLRKEDRGI